MDLGLSQPAIAAQLGVDPATVLNWELGKTQPGARHLRAISHFVGHFPLPRSEGLAAQIVESRQRLGLTQAHLASLLCVAECTVRNWEQGRRHPSRKLLGIVEELLTRACRQ
jgi:DNA-binding transcriptional regulator YiaG